MSALRDDSGKKSGKEMRGARGPAAARADNDYRVGALVVTRPTQRKKSTGGRSFGKGGGGAIGRTQDGPRRESALRPARSPGEERRK